MSLSVSPSQQPRHNVVIPGRRGGGGRDLKRPRLTASLPSPKRNPSLSFKSLLRADAFAIPPPPKYSRTNHWNSSSIFDLNGITEDSVVDVNDLAEEEVPKPRRDFPRHPSIRKKRMINDPENEVHPMMLAPRIDTRNSDFSSTRWKRWVTKTSKQKEPLPPPPDIRVKPTLKRSRIKRKSESNSPNMLYLKGEVVDINSRLEDLSERIDDWIDFLTINPGQRKKKKLNPRHQRLASNEIWFSNSEGNVPRPSWISRAGSDTEDFSPTPSRFEFNPVWRSASTGPLPNRKMYKREASKGDQNHVKRENPVVFHSYKRHGGPLMGGRTLQTRPNKNRFDSIQLDKRSRFPNIQTASLTELPENSFLEMHAEETSISSSSSSSKSQSSTSPETSSTLPMIPETTKKSLFALKIDDSFFDIPGMKAEKGDEFEKKWREKFDSSSNQLSDKISSENQGESTGRITFSDSPHQTEENILSYSASICRSRENSLDSDSSQSTPPTSRYMEYGVPCVQSPRNGYAWNRGRDRIRE